LPNKWLISLTVMCGALMSAVDTTVVNVALPQMRGALGASVEEITWVSTGYMLSMVIVMPIVAFLSARFGRKRFYIFCVVLFTCASTACGFAWDLRSMVAFRIIQGIGGGVLIPIAQAVMRETFPPAEQGTAMGIFGFGALLGPAIGPVIGGWLTDHYSWQWIFLTRWPLGIINVLLIMRYIEDPPYLVRETGRLDLHGILFLAVGLGAFQIMLEKGGREDWFASNFIVSLAVISGIGLALFIWRELTTDKPAVNLRIMKDISFSSATFLGAILGLSLYGSLFLLPIFLQHTLHYSSFDAGIAMMPRFISMMPAMLIGGYYYNRVGARRMIMAGLIMVRISIYQFSILSLDIGYWDIFMPQFLQGVGFGCIFVSISTAALSTLEKPLMMAAAGLYTVVRQVFSSIGIALFATLYTRGESLHRALLMERVTVFQETTYEPLRLFSALFYTQGADMTGAGQGALKMVEAAVMKQASMLAFNHVFFLISVMCVLSIPLVFLIKTGHGQQR
jgi:MFS transporter, DHA2 family, multidrug resistance protein